MADITTIETMTAEEFWDVAQNAENIDKRLMLIDGVMTEFPPARPLNSIVGVKVAVSLIGHSKQHDLGYAFGADAGFTYSPYEVRIHSAAFVSKKRMPDPFPDRMMIPPDLAVEVISPSETPRSINDKIVEVWTLLDDSGDMRVKHLTIEDTLTDGDVLPDFELPIKQIFRK